MPPDNHPFSVGKSLNVGIYDLQFAQHADDLIAKAESEGKVLSVIQYKGRDVLRVSNKRNGLIEAFRRLTGFYTRNARSIQNYRASLPSHMEHRHQESAESFARAVLNDSDVGIQRHLASNSTLVKAEKNQDEVEPTSLPTEAQSKEELSGVRPENAPKEAIQKAIQETPVLASQSAPAAEQVVPEVPLEAEKSAEQLAAPQLEEITREDIQVSTQEAPVIDGQSAPTAEQVVPEILQEVVKSVEQPHIESIVQQEIREQLPEGAAQPKDAVADPLPEEIPKRAALEIAQEASKEILAINNGLNVTPESEILQSTQAKIILVNESPVAPSVETPKKVSVETPTSSKVTPAEVWGPEELFTFKWDLKEALEAYLNESPNLTPKELHMIKGTIGQLQSSNPNLHTIKVRLHLFADFTKEGGLLSRFHFPEDSARPATNKPKSNTPELGGLAPNADVMAEDFSRRAQVLKDKYGKQAHPEYIKFVIDYRNSEIPKGNPFAMAVSDVELFALLRYGGGFYKQVNALLRNDRNKFYEESSEVIAVALNASSALQKLEKAGIIHRSLVHRGIHNFKGFIDKQEGDTFKEDGFMSTSRSTRVLDDFAKFTDQDETDPTVFRMFTKGVPLDPKAGFIEKEEEVLLAPNSEHKILFKGQRPAFDKNGQFLKDVTEIVTEQVGVDPHQGHSESNQWIIDAVLKGFDDLENGAHVRNPADPRLVKDDGDI